MDPRRIGEFIAALRKSRGLTQQEVAEKLNVSNKTISKWERGDGYPEISLIPAIAEIFEVTTDEIFRGTRINQAESESPSNERKIEKQKERLINSSVAKFKNYTLISLALIVLSLVALYTIAYTTFRPILAVAICYVLVIIAISLELIGINNVTNALKARELLADDDPLAIKVAHSLYYSGGFVLTSGITALVLALPFFLAKVLNFSNLPILSLLRLPDGVISFDFYLYIVPVLLIIAGVLSSFSFGFLRSLTGYRDPVETGMMKAVKKRYAQVLVVVLLITVVSHGILFWRFGLPGKLVFEHGVSLERYIEEYEAYQSTKQSLSELEIGGRRRVFDNDVLIYDSQYENVASWDVDRGVVYFTEADPDWVLKMRRGLTFVFGYIYFAEFLLIGAFYFRRKVIIMVDEKNFITISN